jgi:hypothetical protein
MKLKNHLEYPKLGKKTCNFFFKKFTCSINMLCLSQRLKGMCSNHNLRYIKLCDEITMKRKKQTF